VTSVELKSFLADAFNEILGSLSFSQTDIASWCGVGQGAVSKWLAWATDVADHGGNSHAPNEEHLERLMELAREARSVKYLRMDPARWRELAYDGQRWSPIWTRLLRYVCAHADDYPANDEVRAMSDLAAVLTKEDPESVTITVRRGNLSERTQARCYTRQNATIPNAWVVVVDNTLPEDLFCTEALREIQAHILRPKSNAGDLPIENALNGSGSRGRQTSVSSASVGDGERPRGHVDAYQSWVEERSKRETEEKRAIASHVVTHLLGRKTAVQIASGTTESALMDQIKGKRIEDLQISTNNLQVMAKGRGANLGSMTITLTGGELNESIESLIGPDAARTISDKEFMPQAVFFGAAGLTFQHGMCISYAFRDELATQIAYATRPTVNRVLMADHTKLGFACGRRAPVTIESMLATARKCYVVSTFDESAADVIRKEADGLKTLLLPLVGNDEYSEKDFLFRLVDLTGSVVKEYSLGALRRGEWE
jgi:DeoR/GlpR family transcriptional regulator of sugar metabolism